MLVTVIFFIPSGLGQNSLYDSRCRRDLAHSFVQDTSGNIFVLCNEYTQLPYAILFNVVVRPSTDKWDRCLSITDITGERFL
jgi:hypothetical protein